MISYFNSWFGTQDPIDIDEAEDEHAVAEKFDDTPPPFPSLHSIQRSTAPPPRITIPDSELMPPPALPIMTSPPQTSSNTSPTRTSKSTSASRSLLIPPVPNNIRIPSSRGSSNTLQLPPSTTRPPSAPSKRREKVALAPGHSTLDWAALKTSGVDLRGVSNLTRITPSQLKIHNKPDDAWSAIYGKVYNITPYLSFHPGGEKELMRVAGRDGSKLFGLTHSWVNVDMMLDECMVGFLVPEPSETQY